MPSTCLNLIVMCNFNNHHIILYIKSCSKEKRFVISDKMLINCYLITMSYIYSINIHMVYTYIP